MDIFGFSADMLPKLRVLFSGYYVTGWQPARPSGRTCVRLLAGNQHVLQGEHAFAYWLANNTSYGKIPVRFKILRISKGVFRRIFRHVREKVTLFSSTETDDLV